MADPTESDVQALRRRLHDRLDELDALSASGKAGRDPVELDQSSVGRLSRMDAMQGQAMAIETERRRSVERQRIAQALNRIEEGDYGYCIQCGEPIPIGRLKLDPTSPTCVQCASGRTAP